MHDFLYSDTCSFKIKDSFLNDANSNIVPKNRKINNTNIKLNLNLKTDVAEIKGTVNKVKKYDTFASGNVNDKIKTVFTALSPLPPFRRLLGAPDSEKQKDHIKTAGIITIFLANLPEDTRDMKGALNQIFKGKVPEHYKEYQQGFRFFRGTLFEPIALKTGKVGAKLFRWDQSLANTKLGRKLLKLLKIKVEDKKLTKNIFTASVVDEIGKLHILKKLPIFATKFKGGLLKQTIGRSLLRIPVLSVTAAALLELPCIIKAFTNKENRLESGVKQTVKSGISVASIFGMAGFVGALMARKGPAFSITGIGLGALVGSYASKNISNAIDKITGNKT